MNNIKCKSCHKNEFHIYVIDEHAIWTICANCGDVLRKHE